MPLLMRGRFYYNVIILVLLIVYPSGIGIGRLIRLVLFTVLIAFKITAARPVVGLGAGAGKKQV